MEMLNGSKKLSSDLISPLAQVDLDCSGGVDGVALVGVDGNTEQARVGLQYGWVIYQYSNHLFP